MRLESELTLQGLEAHEPFTIKEVARLVHRTPGGFYSMCRAGNGPRITKLGRRVMFTAASIREWIEANTEPEKAAS